MPKDPLYMVLESELEAAYDSIEDDLAFIGLPEEDVLRVMEVVKNTIGDSIRDYERCDY